MWIRLIVDTGSQPPPARGPPSHSAGGLLFTAWGFGGFALALLAGRAYDETGNFNFAYYCSAVLLAVAAVTTFIVKPPHRADRTPVE